MTPAFAFSFVFPFFLLIAFTQWIFHLFGKDTKGVIPTLLIALGTGILVLLPVGGLPLGRWLVSLFPNPSIPLTALLFSRVIKRAFRTQLLDSKAIRTCRLVSVIAGVVLYPMALGVGRLDPYSAGWHFSWLFVFLLAITLGLLFMKNRFSLVLLATIIAYDLDLLESANLWDYLLDPVLVSVSLGALITQMAKRGFGSLSRN